MLSASRLRMPLRVRRFRKYELRRDWMSYFVSVEQLGRRVAHQVGSTDRSYGFSRLGPLRCETFASEAEALEGFHRHCAAAAENRTLIADEERTLEVTDDDADVGAADEALERAALESASPAGAAVYADWLLASGDVRGEVATRFLQGREAEARQLIKENRRALFGRFEEDVDGLDDLGWRDGFLRHAVVGWKHEHLSVAETAHRFLSLPVCRLVSSITVQYPAEARFELPPFSHAPIVDDALVAAVATSPVGSQVTDFDIPGNTSLIEQLVHLRALKRLTVRFGELHGRAAIARLVEHPLMEQLTDLAIRPRGLSSQAANEALSHLLISKVDRLRSLRLHLGFPVNQETRLALAPQLVERPDDPRGFNRELP